MVSKLDISVIRKRMHVRSCMMWSTIRCCLVEDLDFLFLFKFFADFLELVSSIFGFCFPLNLFTLYNLRFI